MLYYLTVCKAIKTLQHFRFSAMISSREAQSDWPLVMSGSEFKVLKIFIQCQCVLQGIMIHL